MTRVVPDFINASPDVLAFLEATNKANARAALEAVGKPASSLAKRLAVFADTTGGLLAESSGLNAAQQGQARADIGADVLGGFRNKIINGDFEIAQRGYGPFVGGIYGIDRWRGGIAGSSLSTTRQAFTVGQTDVPGNPVGFARCVVNSVAGAANLAVYIQFIENVRTLAGKQATLTFWAKADAPRNMSAEFVQVFGTGGSGPVNGIDPQKVALTTAWQKFSLIFNVPSIAGKTIGTNNSLQFNLWFDAGSDYNARTVSLGQQSGTFDIAHVSVVEGDARAEADPFSSRHIEQEVALCQRYYEKSFDLYTAPAQNTGLSSFYTFVKQTANIWYHTVAFKVRKRSTPTLITYSPNTASGDWSANNGQPAASVGGQSEAGFIAIANANGTIGYAYSIHWTADAEL